MKRFLIICALGCATMAMAQERTIGDALSRGRDLYSLGFWREAQVELAKCGGGAAVVRRDNPTVNEEVEYLSAMCQAQLGDGAQALGAFVKAHPDGRFTNDAYWALAEEHHEWQRWGEAVEVYQNHINAERLSDEQLDAMTFGCGHSHYKLGNSLDAVEWLGRLTSASPRYHHAQYLLGVVPYREGRLSDAKKYFKATEESADYAPLVPYYLLNIEHRMGNHIYVARNADNVLDGIEGVRRAEVRRIAAEATFQNDEWSEAERHIVALRDEEGAKLTREENYIAGYALYRLGEWQKAAEYLKGACGAEDRLTRNAAYHLADCLLRWGDKKGAMKCFSMAYAGEDSDPISEDAHYNYCKLQVELGGSNFNEEIRSLQSFLHRYPRSTYRAEVEGYLISACYAANDLKSAYAILEEFATSGGKLREAMQSIAYY